MVKSKFHNQFNAINFKHKPKKDFINVIIPVYKDANGLEDTLKSLQQQIIKNDQFEVIVANDGGDKKVESICKKI